VAHVQGNDHTACAGNKAETIFRTQGGADVFEEVPARSEAADAPPTIAPADRAQATIDAINARVTGCLRLKRGATSLNQIRERCSLLNALHGSRHSG
jgi:hypothetical protein